MTDQHEFKELKKNEDLVRLTLMQADLEFEYPQKLERLRVKADVLKLVEEEEVKMKSIAQQKVMDELRRKVLTYEEYYGGSPYNETQSVGGSRSNSGRSKKDVKYEQFLQETASQYIFDNDLLE